MLSKELLAESARSVCVCVCVWCVCVVCVCVCVCVCVRVYTCVVLTGCSHLWNHVNSSVWSHSQHSQHSQQTTFIIPTIIATAVKDTNIRATYSEGTYFTQVNKIKFLQNNSCYNACLTIGRVPLESGWLVKWQRPRGASPHSHLVGPRGWSLGSCTHTHTHWSTCSSTVYS